VPHRLLLVVILLAIAMPFPRATAQRREPSRVVAIGDIHGDVDALNGILQRAGIIDAGGRWIASDAVLVQLGDVTDRGPRVRAAMDLLMDLERQASAAGGRVAVLLGNHEIMNLLGDGRYVTPAIYETFADQRSAQRRQEAYDAYVRLCRGRFVELGQLLPGISQPLSKEEWMAAHPPGFVEYREAFGPQGRYGRWLRSKPAVLRLNDKVFLHAGINPDRAPRDLDDINKQALAEIRRFDEYRRRMVDRKLALPFFTLSEILTAAQVELQVSASAAKPEEVDPLGLSALMAIDGWSIIHPEGPLWFRGFATWPSDAGATQMTDLLRRYNVGHFVVGHTIPEPKRITPRFSGAVFLIDTGMSSSYVPDGIASALEIRDGRFTAISAAERVTLLEAGKPATVNR
jgi:Calcineurin-like phosphoesterase